MHALEGFSVQSKQKRGSKHAQYGVCANFRPLPREARNGQTWGPRKATVWLAERRNPGTSAEGFANTLRTYHTILTRTVILTQALAWGSIRTSTPTILQPANQLPIPTLAMQQACRRVGVRVPVFEWRAPYIKNMVF